MFSMFPSACCSGNPMYVTPEWTHCSARCSAQVWRSKLAPNSSAFKELPSLIIKTSWVLGLCEHNLCTLEEKVFAYSLENSSWVLVQGILFGFQNRGKMTVSDNWSSSVKISTRAGSVLSFFLMQVFTFSSICTSTAMLHLHISYCSDFALTTSACLCKSKGCKKKRQGN